MNEGPDAGNGGNVIRGYAPGKMTATERFPAEERLRRDQTILEEQKRALELAVNGASLSEVLDVLTLCAERQSKNDIIASILLVDSSSRRLRHGSSPSLPPEYSEAVITHTDVLPKLPCVMPGFTKNEVVIENIQSDPLPVDYKDLARRHGLFACWSVPIFSSAKQVLATFTIYYRQPQKPSADDRSAIELLSRTAGIVIAWFSETRQREEAEAALKKSDQHLRALMAATTDVIYRMSADWKTMWTLYGQNVLSDTTDAIDDWQDKYLLPQDTKAIEAVIQDAIQNKTVFQLEHRVIQADGAVGWTFSRAIPILDDAGNILEWYGVASDVTERKRYETSLAEALSLLESILKNAPIGHGLVNQSYECVQVNEALAAIKQAPAERLIGRPATEVLPVEAKTLLKILRDVFRNARPLQNVEIQAETANNAEMGRSWLATFYPVVVDGFEVKYVGVAALEITDRIKAENALKESEKQFRDFSNRIQNLAWMADGNGWIYWYNKRWFDYTGTTLEQVQGWGWASVHHPDHVARTTEFIRDAWQRGEQWELTFPLKGKDGQYRWFLTRAYPIKDESGKVLRWMGTNTDIHEKLQIQEELQKSRNRLREISDFMPQIVWATDAKGYHDFFNKRWYEFTGLTFEETKGEQWTRVLHPDDIDRTAEVWGRCLRSGEIYEIEYRMKRYDGTFRWMLGRAIALRGSDGAIERWYGTCTDIHDQKTMAAKLEELVRERTKELLRSNEDLQQFAHVSSHDLKEPVRKIQFYENATSEKFHHVLPDQVMVNLRKIRKSANRMAAMIEGVLSYASVDGALMLAEDIDMNSLLNDIADDQELLIVEKKARLVYHNLPVIRGVPILIYQLFYNLINNSLKFSGDAPVLITVTAKQSMAGDQSFWEIVVEDNGIGFDDIYAEEIFGTFTRLNTKDRYEGTGLGLALCKKIVGRHGGSITASARKDAGGARFTVLLPL